jgi:hypothetical protein
MTKPCIIIKGVISLIRSSIGTWPIDDPMNRPEPTGGVFIPRIKFTQNMIPK